jgi:chromosome segregation ATPase
LNGTRTYGKHGAMSPSEYEQLVEILDRRFTEIDRRLDGMDGRFDEVDRRFDEVAHRFDRTDQRIERVEQGLAELRRDMLGHLDAIYGGLERLEQEYQATTQALRRIELTLVDERGRREILQRDLVELKHQVAGLQSRIEEIEERLGS